MQTRNSLLIAGFVAVLTLGLAVSSRAITLGPITQFNKVTFNRPVKLPGVVLPAGTYRFELAPPGTHKDIVRVSAETGRQYFLGFTREVPRPRGLPKNVLMEFGETAPGGLPPIAVWYPLTATAGQAFVYP
jgi:hypothetical protein